MSAFRKMQPRGFALRVIILITGAFAFLLFGYDQGVCGGIVNLTAFLENFDNPGATLLGFMVAAYNIGCFSGAIIAFLIGDRLGRKNALGLGCAILIVGATLQASSFSRAQWIVGRIVAGLGTGSIGSTVPVYISECSEPHMRGPMVVLEIAIIITGIVISSWTNYGFIYHAPSLDGTAAQWRIPVALQMMFPLLVFATLPLCPESPRWLALAGRYDEVPGVIARLRGSDTADADVAHISGDVIQTAKHEREVEGSWKECFQMGELQNFRRLVICSLAGFFQQATGINVVVYYAPTIFRNIGMEGETAYIMSGGNSLCFLLGAILPIFFIEKVGRRRTMIYGSSAVGLCMVAVAASVGVSTAHPELARSAGYAGAFFLYLYVFVFGMSWCSMCWLYASEIASLRLRNKGSALQSMLNWITCFLTVMTTPIGIQTIGWRLYLVWAIVTLAGVPVMYLTFPETTGRTLEQMDAYFAKHQRWIITSVAYDWVDLDTPPTPSNSDKQVQHDLIGDKSPSNHIETLSV